MAKEQFEGFSYEEILEAAPPSLKGAKTVEKKQAKFQLRHAGTFTTVNCIDKEVFQIVESQWAKQAEQYGLKLHISLLEWREDFNEQEKKEFYEGRNIVCRFLTAHKISFKFVKHGYKMSQTTSKKGKINFTGQEGKEFTIYVDLSPHLGQKQWSKLLNELTSRLVDRGISPGYKVSGAQGRKDERVNGSQYMTYRYHKEFKNTSEWPKDDLMKHVRISVKGQSQARIFLHKSSESKPEVSNEDTTCQKFAR